ncbi:MAG: hypothetical protein U5L45_15945 [Saprospiraceae bacterium]|nr:hypothetical protein [Saprospiraceae bacterium]
MAFVARVWGVSQIPSPENLFGQSELGFRVVWGFTKNFRSKKHDRPRPNFADLDKRFGGDSNLYKMRRTKRQHQIKKPDHEWQKDPTISPILAEKLRFIYQNRYQGKNHYGDLTRLGGGDFDKEEAYKGLQNPDAGFRLLALFRYWNIVHYFFPYKYLITEQNWNDVLTQSIPEFIAAEPSKRTFCVSQSLEKISGQSPRFSCEYYPE